VSCPESGYIVLEFIRGPEPDADAGQEVTNVDSYRELTLNHILTYAQAVFHLQLIQRP
jgi:hypothetical protein